MTEAQIIVAMQIARSRREVEEYKRLRAELIGS